MDCDTSGANALLDRVAFFVTEGWQEPAAREAEATIRDLTARGVDADGEAFPAWSDSFDFGKHPQNNVSNALYSPKQQAVRIAAGVSIDIKDLMVTGELFQGLGIRKLSGITSISVASDAGDKLNQIALGQMQHPKWRYHHRFLAVGKEMMRRVYAAILVSRNIGIGTRPPFR